MLQVEELTCIMKYRLITCIVRLQNIRFNMLDLNCLTMIWAHKLLSQEEMIRVIWRLTWARIRFNVQELIWAGNYKEWNLRNRSVMGIRLSKIHIIISKFSTLGLRFWFNRFVFLEAFFYVVILCLSLITLLASVVFREAPDVWSWFTGPIYQNILTCLFSRIPIQKACSSFYSTNSSVKWAQNSVPD